MTKRVALVPQETPGVRYAGGFNLRTKLDAVLSYVVEARCLELPSESGVRLQQVVDFALAVDDVFELIDAGTMSQDCLEMFKNVAFRWHVGCRNGERGDMDVYTNTVSWSSLCRTYLAGMCLGAHGDLGRAHGEALEDLDRCADEFVFMRRVSQTELTVTTDEPLSNYAVDNLWDATRTMFGITAAWPNSLEMKRYFSALFGRYCEVLTLEQDGGVYDSYLYCTGNVASQEGLPVQGDGSRQLNYLSPKFISDTEVLLFGLVRRFNLAKWLDMCLERVGTETAGHPTGLLDHVASVQSRSAMAMRSVTNMVRAVSQGILESHITNKFSSMLASMYVECCERERFSRECPEMHSHSENILAMLRPHDFVRFAKLKRETMHDLCEQYEAHMNDVFSKRSSKCLADAFEADADTDTDTESTAHKREDAVTAYGDLEQDIGGGIHDAEPAFKAATYVCTKVWMKRGNKASKALRKSMLFEHLHAWESIEARLNALYSGANGCPVLVSFFGWYYVFDGSPFAMKSRCLATVYCVWMSRCLHSANLNRADIPDQLLETVEKFGAFGL